MDKKNVPSNDKERHPTRWILWLTFLTAIQTLGFVGVSVITYYDTLDLDQKETTLRQNIKYLVDTFQSLDEDTNVDSEDISVKLDSLICCLVDSSDPCSALCQTALIFQHNQFDEQRQTVLDKARRQVTKRFGKRQSSLFVEMIKIQEQILEKHCRDRNKTCPSGPRGDKGPIGQQGSDGLQGPPGHNGLPGLQGQPGYPGSKGAKGEIGPRGDPGVAGGVGPAGANGSRGEDGVKGSKGEPGPIGIQGPRGDNGNRGKLGQAGSPGINGTAGQQGENGETGVKGIRGELGVQGIKGNDSRKFADDCECLNSNVLASSADTSLYGSYSSEIVEQFDSHTQNVPPYD